MSDLDFLHGLLDGKAMPISPSDITEVEFIIVEDDPVLGSVLKRYLEKKFSIKVELFKGPGECLEYFEDGPNPEMGIALITDISFGDGAMDGLLLIDLLKEKGVPLMSIVMTGFASIQNAIEATKKGVHHYLTKPFDPASLASISLEGIEKTFNIRSAKILRLEGPGLSSLGSKSETFSNSGKYRVEVPGEKDIFCGMIGRSRIMKNVFSRIQRVGNSHSTVLISGHSGVGKELVASSLHKLSPREQKKMVSINCGAIPSELLESELFGHFKGSFTGAISDRVGRFGQADKGTIFLDEIGDMPFLLQVKLLRVLQNKEIEPLGSTKSIRVDTRIIAATHRNLEKEVELGNFREDLYYRLNVIPIHIPSLKDRKEDIPLFIGHFLNRFTSADGRNSLEFSDGALDLLVHYEWPGNVRELENLVERLVILKGGSLVKVADLPTKILKYASVIVPPSEELIELPNDGIDLKKALAQIENSLISQALKRTEGNKNQASKLLNMNRTTLIEKLKKSQSQSESLR